MSSVPRREMGMAAPDASGHWQLTPSASSWLKNVSPLTCLT